MRRCWQESWADRQINADQVVVRVSLCRVRMKEIRLSPRDEAYCLGEVGGYVVEHPHHSRPRDQSRAT